MPKIENYSRVEPGPHDNADYKWEHDHADVEVLVGPKDDVVKPEVQISRGMNVLSRENFDTKEEARKWAVGWMKNHPGEAVDKTVRGGWSIEITGLPHQSLGRADLDHIGEKVKEGFVAGEVVHSEIEWRFDI